MAKTKISEFNANPALNTDIDSINIAEGCAPSGINDAIRELMSQLKDWQAGTSNDPMVIGSTGSLTLNQGTANGVAYLNGSKVVTSGSALTFDGTNLGVGVSSPNQLLDVRGANGIGIRFLETSTGNTNRVQLGTGSGFGYIDATAGSGSTALAFQVASSEQMRLTSTGLGIGTSSPSTKLHVTSSTQAYPFRIQVTAGSTAGIEFEDPTTGTNRPNIASRGTSLTFETNSSERMRLDASGNLGIGTSSPAARLAVDSGSTALNANFNSTNASGVYLRFQNSGTSIGDLGSGANLFSGGTVGDFGISSRSGNLVLGTGSVERARIDSSGNLLVGATTTSLISTNTAGTAIKASGGVQLMQTANTSDWGIKSTSGTVCNFYSWNGSAAVAAGLISVNGATTTYGTSSDYRLKNVIGAISDSGKRIDALEPIEYTWKADGSPTRGFLAHKFQEVYANSVTGTKDAVDEEGNPVYQAMQASSSEVIADLVAEIKSLRARVAQLESN